MTLIVFIGFAEEQSSKAFLRGDIRKHLPRAMSRIKAKKAAAGRNIIQEMEAKGIIVRGESRRTVDEEISEAYKEVYNIVDACALAGISRKAQLRPLGCIKG